jgi:hypothetical protein
VSALVRQSRCRGRLPSPPPLARGPPILKARHWFGHASQIADGAAAARLIAKIETATGLCLTQEGDYRACPVVLASNFISRTVPVGLMSL